MEKITEMYVKMQSMLRDEKGATMVEYALMVVGLALVALAGAQVLGTDLSNAFKDIGGKVAVP